MIIIFVNLSFRTGSFWRSGKIPADFLDFQFLCLLHFEIILHFSKKTLKSHILKISRPFLGWFCGSPLAAEFSQRELYLFVFYRALEGQLGELDFRRHATFTGS